MDFLAFVGGTLRGAVSALVTSPPTLSTVKRGGFASPGSGYEAGARAYSTNEIVYAAVKLLCTSAAEPHIIGKRLRRNPNEIRNQVAAWKAMGITNRAGSRSRDQLLVFNKYVEEVTNHPLVNLLNNPNPYTSRGQLWSTVVMDRYLGGNAYLLKGRNQLLGNVQELWRLRPDRVRIIPGRSAPEAYEYTVGDEKVRFPAADVLHFKDPNPLDDFYGMPPLMPIMGRVSIDNYMRGFLQTFFERGGTGPGAILTLKNKLPDEAKEAIRDKMRMLFRGPDGFHETLILDNTDSSYTQMGLDRGLRDALPKELDSMNEARIAMAFGIPGSILGLLIGYESSSYANKRQDWQVLWDVTMTPLLSDIDDVLNLGLVPEFGGINEVCFDLSDIRALQEDEEALQERARKNFMAGIWSWQETRALTGVEPLPGDGIFFIPTNVEAIPVDRVGEEPPPPPAPVVPPAPGQEQEEAAAVAMAEAFPLLSAPRRGRPPVTADPVARMVYEKGEELRAKHPGMTIEQVAGRLNVSERTYRRYRQAFSENLTITSG